MVDGPENDLLAGWYNQKWTTLASSTEELAQTFGGPRATLARALRSSQAYDAGTSAVLDDRGTPLAIWPVRGWTPAPAAAAAIRAALAGRVGISNLDPARGGTLTIAVPIRSRAGRRVVVEDIPASMVASFASAYLATAPAIRGGEGFLVDGHGLVLASSERLAPGAVLPQQSLTAALRVGRHGAYADRYFAAAPLARTPLRVVLTAPHGALLRSVAAARRTAWMQFAAFALALAARPRSWPAPGSARTPRGSSPTSACTTG